MSSWASINCISLWQFPDPSRTGSDHLVLKSDSSSAIALHQPPFSIKQPSLPSLYTNHVLSAAVIKPTLDSISLPVNRTAWLLALHFVEQLVPQAAILPTS